MAQQPFVIPVPHPAPSDAEPGIHLDLALAVHAMPSASNPDARLKRLRWRCRRGTRELDALLGGWLDRHGTDVDPEPLQAFDALLDQQDPELWGWLLGHAEPHRADWQAIVADIRMHAGMLR